MPPAAAAIAVRPPRVFWAAVLLVDLLLLAYLVKIPWVALGLGLLLVAAGFVWRVEWLLAFLLLGMPFLAPLPLEEDAFTLILMALRGLFLAGWWVAHGRAHRAERRATEGLAADACGARPAPARTAVIGRVLRDPLSLAAVLLAVWLWLGLAWTDAPRYGASKVIAIFLGNLFLFFAPFLLWSCRGGPRVLDGFLRAAILLGAVFAAFGVASALGLAEQLSFGALVRVQLVTQERLAWLGISQIWTARMLAVWLVLVLWGAQRRLLRPPLAVLLAAVALLLIIRTGSRGPLAALLLSPLALLLLPRRNAAERRPVTAACAREPDPPGRATPRRSILRAAIPAALVMAVVVAALLPAETRTGLSAALLRGPLGLALGGASRAEEAGAEVGVRLTQDPSAHQRLHLARRSLAALPEMLPWGAGTGAFAARLFLRDIRLYPHNIFAELLFENGWPGLLLFGAFLLLIWRSARRLSRRSAAGRWLFVLAAMALLNAQVSGDIGTNEWLWLWAGLIGGLRVAVVDDREGVRA